MLFYCGTPWAFHIIILKQINSALQIYDKRLHTESVWFSLCLKHSLFEICYYSLSEILNLVLSLVMRKPFFGIGENKDADQLRGNREPDQRLCFRYTDSTIPLFPKSGIPSL